MKKRLTGIALAGALALGFVGAPAHAAPSIEPDDVVWPIATPGDPVAANETMNVLVMLKQQPNGHLDKQVGTVAVRTVADRWAGKNGITIRRSFGLLVRGFSATVPVSMVAQIEKDPDVASVTELATYYPSMEAAGELTKSVQARKNLGIDGRGLVVSVIDSGIDIEHKDYRLDPGVEPRMAPEPGHTAKIPYSWNFADGNAIVKDTGSQHGQHVAGIIGANGTDAEVASGDAVDGIAPNAQLLAMKVFSNDRFLGGGASEDDIIAAIEKSVELKADIINMSLGSPNGFSNNAVGEGRAIQEAANAGVQVIVAAGNDGLNYSKTGTTVDNSGLLDNGPMSNPAATPGAFTIASVNNTKAMAAVGSYKQGDTSGTFTFHLSKGATDGQPHTIVNCGFGKPTEIPETAKGNWCLIQRGDGVTFVDKGKNAQAAGATGVVLYNNAGDAFVNPALDGVDITFATIWQSTGEAIKAEIAKGQTTVSLSSKMVPVPTKDPLVPSDFTTFGTTPELEFKPQLAGIGGNVWSLANDNGYQDMSGTSMATPHVAGVFALGLQHYQKTYPNMSSVERGALLKISLSNTAQILKQADGVPFPTRQQGAGLANTEAALTTQVFATVNGQPNISLKQMTGAKTYTISLENKGDQAATYTVDNTCVVNEVQVKDTPLKTVCSAADTIKASAPTVTVPAKGTATVDVTVTPDLAARHWVGGWTLFASSDPKVPSLSLPFMGFAGDWNAEPIIEPQYGQPGAGTLVKLGAATGNSTMLLTKDPTMVRALFGSLSFISPNGDGDHDEIFGSYAMLRSAKTMKFSIVDKDGKVLVQLGQEEGVSRRIISKIAKANGSFRSNTHSWDGKLYDPKTDSFVYAPEGEYFYRAEACLGIDDRCQVLDQSFKIDVTKPTLTTTQREAAADGSHILDLVVSDQGPVQSGISIGIGVSMTDAQTGAAIKLPYLSGGKTSVTIPAATKMVKIRVTDYAGNTTTEYVTMGADKVIGFQASAALNGWVNKKSKDEDKNLIIHDGLVTLPIIGAAEFTSAKLEIKQTPLPKSPKEAAGAPITSTADVKLDKGLGSYDLKVIEGENQVTITATDAAGKSYTGVTTVKVDVTGPMVRWTNKAEVTDAQGKVKLDAEGNVVIKGVLWDNRAKPGTPDPLPADFDPMSTMWALTIEGGKITPLNGISSDGTFEITIAPEATDAEVELYFLDGYDLGAGGMLNISALRDADGNIADLTLARAPSTQGGSAPMSISFNDKRFDGADPRKEPFGSGAYILDRTYDIKNVDGKPVLQLGGFFNRAPGSFRVNGAPVTLVKGSMFAVDIPLQEGITSVPFEIREADGTIVSATQWKFLYDKTLPSMDLTTTPAVARDGAIWLQQAEAKIKMSGTVSDNAFGYTLKVNGNVVQNFTSIWDPGKKVNERKYATEIQGADAQFIRISLNDVVGNGFEQTIPIKSDATAPAVTFHGVQPGGKVDNSQAITVKVEDAHLNNMRVFLDGKELVLKEAPLAPSGAKTTMSSVGDSGKSLTALAVAAPQPGSLLTYELPPGIADGSHEVKVTALDLAGNATTEKMLFTVSTDLAPVIGGPAAAEIDPDKGDLVAQIKALFPVTDDKDKGLTVSVDRNALRYGETVDVTLTATDSASHMVTKVVKITVMRPMTTLKGDCGTISARFVAGDTVTITCTKQADGTTRVVVKNAGAPVMGTIRLPGLVGPIQLAPVKAKATSSSEMLTPVAAMVAEIPWESIDGALVFTGSSQADYLAGEETPVPTTPPTDSTLPTDPDDESIPGKETKPDKPAGPSADQPVTPSPSNANTGSALSNTGLPAGALPSLALGLVAVAAGIGLARKRS